MRGAPPFGKGFTTAATRLPACCGSEELSDARFPLTASGDLHIEAEGGVHHSDVRQRLRKIAQQGAAFDINFFRVQSDVIAAREEFLEKLSRFGNTSADGQGFDQPEAASEKCALARRQTVVGAHFVAIQKVVA